jgi:hypothetical protein
VVQAKIAELRVLGDDPDAFRKVFNDENLTVEERQAIVRQMLDLAYDDAPYLPLFYDDSLDAHRTDRFGGWSSASDGTTPLFTTGVGGYLALGPPAAPEPSSTTPPAVPTAAPTASLTATPAPSAISWLAPGYATVVLAGALLAVIALILLLIAARARSRKGPAP